MMLSDFQGGSVFSGVAIRQRRAAMTFLRTYAAGLHFEATASSYLNPLYWFTSPPPTRQTFLNLFDRQDAWLDRIEAGQDVRLDALIRWDTAFLEILDGLEKIYRGARIDVLRNVGMTVWETTADVARLPRDTVRGIGSVTEWVGNISARIQENPKKYALIAAVATSGIVFGPALAKRAVIRK